MKFYLILFLFFNHFSFSQKDSVEPILYGFGLNVGYDFFRINESHGMERRRYPYDGIQTLVSNGKGFNYGGVIFRRKGINEFALNYDFKKCKNMVEYYQDHSPHWDTISTSGRTLTNIETNSYSLNLDYKVYLKKFYFLVGGGFYKAYRTETVDVYYESYQNNIPNAPINITERYTSSESVRKGLAPRLGCGYSFINKKINVFSVDLVYCPQPKLSWQSWGFGVSYKLFVKRNSK